jgi:hypothetical protein
MWFVRRAGNELYHQEIPIVSRDINIRERTMSLSQKWANELNRGTTRSLTLMVKYQYRRYCCPNMVKPLLTITLHFAIKLTPTAPSVVTVHRTTPFYKFLDIQSWRECTSETVQKYYWFVFGRWVQLSMTLVAYSKANIWKLIEGFLIR